MGTLYDLNAILVGVRIEHYKPLIIQVTLRNRLQSNSNVISNVQHPLLRSN